MSQYTSDYIIDILLKFQN